MDKICTYDIVFIIIIIIIIIIKRFNDTLKQERNITRILCNGKVW